MKAAKVPLGSIASFERGVTLTASPPRTDKSGRDRLVWVVPNPDVEPPVIRSPYRRGRKGWVG